MDTRISRIARAAMVVALTFFTTGCQVPPTATAGLTPGALPPLTALTPGTGASFTGPGAVVGDPNGGVVGTADATDNGGVALADALVARVGREELDRRADAGLAARQYADAQRRYDAADEALTAAQRARDAIDQNADPEGYRRAQQAYLVASDNFDRAGAALFAAQDALAVFQRT